MTRAADPGDGAAPAWPAATVAHLARRVVTAPAALGDSRLVCVDGPAGSGKTTLARQLVDALRRGPHTVALVHMDDVYAGWDGLEEGVRNLARWLIGPLAQRRPAQYRRFDWAGNAYSDWRTVEPAGVVVVEGVGAASRALGDHAVLRVWVELPEAERTARWLARDGTAVRRHIGPWQRLEEAHFAADGTAGRADVRLP